MAQSPCRIAAVMLFSLVAFFSQAQTNSDVLVNHRRGSARQYASSQETHYQRNGRVVLYQLAALGKKLDHLSVVDPAAYVPIQSELHNYLLGLENHASDYGAPEIYHSVLHRLTQFEERVKEAIARSREQASASITADSLPQAGQQARVRPYALLFRRRDYRSKLLHIVTSQEVTILEPGSTYCLVQSGLHKGYLHNGMIVW